jgi:hypothetical protein
MAAKTFPGSAHRPVRTCSDPQRLARRCEKNSAEPAQFGAPPADFKFVGQCFRFLYCLKRFALKRPKIEASFGAAIRIAKEQKSVSLEKRVEATYAEYRRQKESALGGNEV